MNSLVLSFDDFVDSSKDVILKRCTGSKKILSYKLVFSLVNAELNCRTVYIVRDAVGKIRYFGEHFSLAIKSFNKLYNPDR